MQSHLKIIRFLEKRKFAFGNEACQLFSLYQAEKAIWNPLQTNIFPFKTREGEKREAATPQAGNFTHGLFSSGCHQKKPLFLSQKDHFFLFLGKEKWWDGLFSQRAVVVGLDCPMAELGSCGAASPAWSLQGLGCPEHSLEPALP